MMQKDSAKLWTPRFMQVCVLNLLMFLGFHMLVATFAFYVKALGGDEAMAGLAAGMFSVSSVLMRPIAGWILDNKGRRTILLIGLSGMVLFPLLYSACSVLFLALIFRLLHGVVWSCASTSQNTIACDLIPKKRFGEGMGYFGLTSALATAIAPSVGLFLMEEYGFGVMFRASSVIIAFALCFAFAMRSTPLPDKPKVDLLHSIRTLINRDALPASVITLLFLCPYGAATTFIALYAYETGLPSGGIFFSIMAVTTAAARVSLGKVVDRHGEAVMVYCCNIVMFLALMLLAFFPNAGVYFCAAFLLGAAIGSMPPTMQAMAMHKAKPERRGSASSTFLCAFDIGIGLGGMISGVLVKFFGYNPMYAMMSIFVLASVACYLFWGSKHSSSFSYARRFGSPK